jgi:integrase/recombinase XerD
MKEIVFRPLLHRGMECIGIYFEFSSEIQGVLQKTGLVKFSITEKCWYTHLCRENYHTLCIVLKGLAVIEQSALRRYLADKRGKTGGLQTAPGVLPVKSPVQHRGAEVPGPAGMICIHQNGKVGTCRPEKIQPVNAHVLPLMKQKLTLKAYSPSTIKTYLNEMAQLLHMIHHISADELNPELLRRYLVYCHEKLKLSENTLHSRINAMKFYYEQVLLREKFFFEIPRPKKPLLLPKLLNEKELSALFNTLENKKHKAMLFTAYSAGLRVSEIVNLKISNIDSGRMQILVARAKGKKDRYVNPSPILLDILRQYIVTYKPRPRLYLFESEQTFGAYPTRTVQQIFSNAKHKAGIRKEVGVHSLRHSFATHLLDKGTDIKYIKDLPGHFNIKTTERYLHVSKKQLVNITSPFDDLWKKEHIDW